MVLTNFECWAHGGAVVGNDGLPLNTRNVDLFNPRVVQQSLEAATGVSSISHISSNGYYGFSYVNAAHQPANSSHNSAVNTHNICNMPNNNNRNVPNANDVNGMPTMHNGMEIEGAVGGTATALSKGCDAIQRCKKRFFVSDDDYANCALLNSCESGVGVHDVAVAGLNVRAAKRCRFDDDFTAAQYCNDFFSLPSTQIGTQSCLMDTDDTQQHERQQPQVDVTMGAENFTNQATNTIARCESVECDADSRSSVINSCSKNNNTTNQNDNKIYYNKYTTSVRGGEGGYANGSIVQCGHDGDGGVCDNIHLMSSAHTINGGSKTVIVHSFDSTAISNASEDTTGVATLYATIHGGAFYHFAAITADNQSYIEDI